MDIKKHKINFLFGIVLWTVLFFAIYLPISQGSSEEPTDVITRAKLERMLQEKEYERIYMIDNVIKSVVFIQGWRGSDKFTGSGFFISPHTIITNEHVLKDLEQVTIKTYDGKYCTAGFTQLDHYDDIATVETDCNQPYLDVNYHSTRGQSVFAIGNPTAIPFNVSQGIVSSVQQDWIYFDATINFGSSGGPLINAKGEVIGIVTAKSSDKENWFGLAIPIESAKSKIENAIAQEDIKDREAM